MNNTLPSILYRNSKINAEGIWLRSPETDKKLSWKQVYKRCKEIAYFLYNIGAKRGEPIAIASRNCIGSCTAFMGITYGGFIATPLNLVAGAKSIKYVINHSNVKIIFVENESKKLIEDIIIDLKQKVKLIVFHSEDFISTLCTEKKNKKKLDFKDIDQNTPGLLMYTSGTTGNPKGVLLSHKNLLAAGENIILAHSINKTDIALCVLPIYHINGLCVTLLGTLVSCSSLIIPYKFSIKYFWYHINDYSCTWVSAVPTLFAYLLNDSKKINGKDTTLKFARSASSPLSPEIHKKFEKRFKIPIIETMGLTETGAQILSNPLPPGLRKIGSPGKAVGNEIAIGDKNQNFLPEGVQGEILVRGDNVMLGYLKQEKETKKTITKSGWLRTGDLGYMDEDGYVFVTGRIKELIIKGGENIAPREIDEVLLEHSKILEAAAFAVPCENYGQKVEACVTFKNKQEITKNDLLDFCVKRLGKFKAPEKIHIFDDLPKGPSGKIQRLKLYDLVYS